MAGAEQYQIVDVGASVVFPEDQVVRFAARRVGAAHDAATISNHECVPLVV